MPIFSFSIMPVTKVVVEGKTHPCPRLGESQDVQGRQGAQQHEAQGHDQEACNHTQTERKRDEVLSDTITYITYNSHLIYT
jgi:hypothetical protein